MSFFIDQHNRRKSPIALAAFCAAGLDLFVFGVLYALLAEPLYRGLSLGSAAATNAAHSLVIAVAGTAVCSLLFLLKDKRVAPYGFAGLAVLLCMFYTAALLQEPAARDIMLVLISWYGLAPVLVGNAVTWPIYLEMKRRNPALNHRKTIQEELREAAEKQASKQEKKTRKKEAPQAAPAKQPRSETPPGRADAQRPRQPESGSEETLFGPERGEGSAAPFRSAQEEAMLLYEDDEEESDD